MTNRARTESVATQALPAEPRWSIVAVAAAGVILIAQGLAVAPLFLGRDVAVLAAICQIPWVLVSLDRLTHSTPRWARSVAGVLLVAGAALLSTMIAALPREWLAPIPGAVLRTVIVGGLILGCGLIGGPMRHRGESPVRFRRPMLAAGIWAFVAIVPPSLFLQSRFEAEFQRVRELLEQSRFTEAARTLDRLAWYPTDNRLLGVDRKTLTQHVRAAERLTRQELAAREQHPDREAQILDRARLHAMLAQEPTALALLASVESPTPASRLLEGTIRETQEQWPAAREAYQAALADLSSITLEDRAQGLRGIAYCERKLGHAAAAEAALLQLLKLQPTAETHFLLGRFYEDAQSSGPARHHLQKAVDLDPGQYKTPAEALFRRLRQAHFGCFVVPSKGT